MSNSNSLPRDLLKLDLACGQNKREGFIGIDLSKKNTQADVEWDLEKYPWPFENASIEEIRCSHYIEHTKDLFAFMNEIWRILKWGKQAEFIAPYYSSVRAFQDPTHTRFISENTFYYFNREWREKNGLSHYPVQADFRIKTIDYVIDDEFKGLPPQDLEYAKKHLWNVILDFRVILNK